MKEHRMSQPVAPPVDVPITISPSADALMTEWLAERVKRAIELVIDAAPRCGVHLKGVWVEGWESYEEPTRELVVIPNVETSDEAGFEYWGILADAVYELNQPPPEGAENGDVTVQVSVYW
jgi:hypothetical protein